MNAQQKLKSKPERLAGFSTTMQVWDNINLRDVMTDEEKVFSQNHYPVRVAWSKNRVLWIFIGDENGDMKEEQSANFGKPSAWWDAKIRDGAVVVFHNEREIHHVSELAKAYA